MLCGHAFHVGCTFDVTIQIKTAAIADIYRFDTIFASHQATDASWVTAHHLLVFSDLYPFLPKFALSLCCRHHLLCNSIWFIEPMFHAKWWMTHNVTMAWYFLSLDLHLPPPIFLCCIYHLSCNSVKVYWTHARWLTPHNIFLSTSFPAMWTNKINATWTIT